MDRRWEGKWNIKQCPDHSAIIILRLMYITGVQRMPNKLTYRDLQCFQQPQQCFVVSWSNKVSSVSASTTSLIYCLKQHLPALLPPLSSRALSGSSPPWQADMLTTSSLPSSPFSNCRLETNQSSKSQPPPHLIYSVFTIFSTRKPSHAFLFVQFTPPNLKLHF